MAKRGIPEAERPALIAFANKLVKEPESQRVIKTPTPDFTEIARTTKRMANKAATKPPTDPVKAAEQGHKILAKILVDLSQDKLPVADAMQIVKVIPKEIAASLAMEKNPMALREKVWSIFEKSRDSKQAFGIMALGHAHIGYATGGDVTSGGASAFSPDPNSASHKVKQAFIGGQRVGRELEAGTAAPWPMTEAEQQNVNVATHDADLRNRTPRQGQSGVYAKASQNLQERKKQLGETMMGLQRGEEAGADPRNRLLLRDPQYNEKKKAQADILAPYGGAASERKGEINEAVAPEIAKWKQKVAEEQAYVDGEVRKGKMRPDRAKKYPSLVHAKYRLQQLETNAELKKLPRQTLTPEATHRQRLQYELALAAQGGTSKEIQRLLAEYSPNPPQSRGDSDLAAIKMHKTQALSGAENPDSLLAFNDLAPKAPKGQIPAGKMMITPEDELALLRRDQANIPEVIRSVVAGRHTGNVGRYLRDTTEGDPANSVAALAKQTVASSELTPEAHKKSKKQAERSVIRKRLPSLESKEVAATDALGEQPLSDLPSAELDALEKLLGMEKESQSPRQVLEEGLSPEQQAKTAARAKAGSRHDQVEKLKYNRKMAGANLTKRKALRTAFKASGGLAGLLIAAAMMLQDEEA